MNSRNFIPAFVAVLACVPLAIAGDKPAPGKVTRVACTHDETQTYACYLPRKFDKSRKWPILYCFSPNANGQAFVDHYKDVCEKHGWIVVASNNARNGPWGPIKAAMDAMWKDTQARFPTHETRCYATGWSGGSGVAFDLAGNNPKRFAGVIPIAMGSGWDRVLPRLPEHVSVFFVIGDKDAVAQVKAEDAKLREKGHKTKVSIFSGGHVWPPKKNVENGVDWLESITPRPSAARQFKELGKLTLKKDVSKKLRTAVKYAARGNFKAALSAAEKVLGREKSTDAEKADAKYIKEEITARLNQMVETSDKLLEEGLPFEAKTLLDMVRKSASAEKAKQAQDKAKEITSNKDLRNALRAGDLYNKALDLEEKGKMKKAKATFLQVVKKYPDTKYAEMAKGRT
jgi:hypothetical protein